MKTLLSFLPALVGLVICSGLADWADKLPHDSYLQAMVGMTSVVSLIFFIIALVLGLIEFNS